jgi:branched-chain amino acid transport system substrate-binding protein
MGGYVGRTKLDNGKGVMGSFRYIDGASVLPSAEEVRKLRPAD